MSWDHRRDLGRIRGPFENPEFVRRYNEKVKEALRPKPREKGPVNSVGKITWTGALGNHYCGSKSIDSKHPLYNCSNYDGQCGP